MTKENKFQFCLLDVGTMEELRDYETLEEAFKDLHWKVPESFCIGVIEEKRSYTIPQFIKKYKKEYEEFEKNLK